MVKIKCCYINRDLTHCPNTTKNVSGCKCGYCKDWYCDNHVTLKLRDDRICYRCEVECVSIEDLPEEESEKESDEE